MAETQLLDIIHRRGRQKIFKIPLTLIEAKNVHEKLRIGNCGEALAAYYFRCLGWQVLTQTGSGDTVDMAVFNPDEPSKRYYTSVKTTKSPNPEGRWLLSLSQGDNIPFNADSYDFLVLVILPEMKVEVHDAKNFHGMTTYTIDRNPMFFPPDNVPVVKENTKKKKRK